MPFLSSIFERVNCFGLFLHVHAMGSSRMKKIQFPFQADKAVRENLCFCSDCSKREHFFLSKEGFFSSSCLPKEKKGNFFLGRKSLSDFSPVFSFLKFLQLLNSWSKQEKQVFLSRILSQPACGEKKRSKCFCLRSSP